MNLYLVSRTDRDQVSYDEYDAFVVAASNEIEATLFLLDKHDKYAYSDWPALNKTEVKLIGTTTEYTETTEILGSFNAG